MWDKVRDGKVADENVGGFEELVEPSTEEHRRAGVCERTAIGRARANEEGLVFSTHRNVFGAFEKIRPDTEVRRDADGRTRARASQKSGRGHCRRKIPRAAARFAVGRERFAGGEGVPDNRGRGRVLEPGGRRKADRGETGRAGGWGGVRLGSERLGAISSPSTRCGCTGLRPSFGLVPRTGAMALSWSMDKLGPICRTVEDCALVLNAIYGRDGKDRAVQPAAFNWDATLEWRDMRVGYLKSAFERKPDEQQAAAKEEPPATPEEAKKREERKKRRHAARPPGDEDRKFNDAALAKLREMGAKLVPVEMPKFP